MLTFESAPHYFSWGWVQISVANLIVIGTMVLIFIAAVAFRMPTHREEHRQEPRHDDD